jgi:hypothetical protein
MNYLVVRNIVLVSLVTLIYSCETKADLEYKDINEFRDLNTVPIKGEPTGLIEDGHLVTASNLILIDSLLIVQRNIPHPYYYEIYGLNSKTRLVSIGQQGNGPNELPEYGISKVVNRSEGVLGMIIPNQSGRYYELDLKNLNNSSELNWRAVFDFGYDNGNVFEKVSDSLFVALPLASEKRMVLIRNDGSELSSFIDYPFELETPNFPKDLLGMLHQAQLVSNKLINRVGIFNLNSVCWEIWNMENPFDPVPISINHLSKPDARDASKKLSPTSFSKSVSFSALNNSAFIDVEATDEYIYALYGDRNYKEHGQGVFFGNYVLVFSWEGELLKKIQLDLETNCIAVTMDDSKLYTIVELGDKDNIYVYNLNKDK